ncbi:MAG: FadR family transcriptional regulator [Desulfobacterales bacterium]|nr:MAG: FadR family transcriptional regulator [Desulfobacterales bacterium]
MVDGQNIFAPVQAERVSQLVEGQLKEAIIKHHYRAGDKLPSERELAHIFGASRSSIREAIRALERSGFVVVKKGVQGGAFVIQKGNSKPMVDHLRDMLRLRQVSLEEILQARLIIEPEIAAEAARKATAKDIELLEEITRDQLRGFDSENPVMQYDRNPRFHRIIAEMTGNQVFIIIMQILMEIHAFRMNQFSLDKKTIRKITHQHDGIIEALKKKDEEKAFEEMKKHVLDVHHMHKMLDDKKK